MCPLQFKLENSNKITELTKRMGPHRNPPACCCTFPLIRKDVDISL